MPASWRIQVPGLKLALFAYFVVYGYYGAVSPVSGGLFEAGLALVISLALMVPLFLYRTYGSRLEHEYQWELRVTRRELCVAAFALAGLLALSHGRLSESLYSDELSYAASSHGHAIFLALQLARFDFFSDLEIRYLVQAASFLMLGFLLIIWRCIVRMECAGVFPVFVAAFMGLRFLFWIRGGNGNPHPPLELLPVFFSGVLFGINEAGLKVSYLLSYFFFLFVVYRLCRRQLASSFAWKVAAVVGTVPLMLSMGTVIEHAVWGYIFFTIVLLDLWTANSVNYQRVLLIVALGSLFRQSVFIALLPIALVYLLDPARPGLAQLRIARAYWLIPPLILFVPFVGRSLLMGTPATESIDKGMPVSQWYDALASGVAIDSFLTAFHPAWATLLVLAFIPIRKAERSRHLIFSIFFIALWMVYHSIDRGLWGMKKYQAECFGPFIALGVFLLFRLLASLAARSVAVVACIVFVSANVMQFFSRDGSANPGYSISVSYNYRDAYARVRELGLAKNTYSIGLTYGILPEVINRYSASEALSAQAIHRRQRDASALPVYLTADIRSVLADQEIKAVLIQGGIGAYDLRAGFKEAGWQEVEQFPGGDPGAVVYLMRRSADGSPA